MAGIAWLKTRVLSWALIFAAGLAVADAMGQEDPAPIMQRIVLDGAGSEILSRCADGSPYAFFVERRPSSGTWILFLQGGALSRTEKEAVQRFEQEPSLFSSTGAPSQYGAKDLGELFSHDPTLNPAFHDANKVYLPYCSQDLFLGARPDSIPKPSAPNASNYNQGLSTLYFRGALNVIAALQWLDTRHADMPAERVLLSGTSAGGTGVMAHTYALLSTLASAGGTRSQPAWLASAAIQVLIDSAWFVNQDSILEQVLLQGLDLPAFYSTPGTSHGNLTAYLCDAGTANSTLEPEPWQDLYFSFMAELCSQNSSDGYPVPCCAETQCALREVQARHPDTPILLLTSKYDPYTLYLGLNAGASAVKKYEQLLLKSNPSLSELVEVVNFVEEYGGVTLGQIKRALDAAPKPQNNSLSVFVSPCFHHGFLVMVTDRAAQDDVLTNGMFQFTFFLDMWHQYFDNGDTQMPAFVADWWTTTNGTRDAEALVSLPSCKGVDCNPKCAPVLNIPTKEDVWQWTDGSSLGIACLAVYVAVIVMALGCNLAALLSARRHRGLFKSQEEMIERASSAGSRSYISASSRRFCKADLQKQADSLRPDRAMLEKPWLAPNMSIAFSHLNVWTNTHKLQLLHDVSGFINPWQMTAIMGPSGCGKTTLLKTIAGLTPFQNIEGDFLLNGYRLTTPESYKSLRTRVGFVPQSGGTYFPSLTVKENMMYAALLRLPTTTPLKERFSQALSTIETVGLYSHLNTVVGGNTSSSGGLSGGQV